MWKPATHGQTHGQTHYQEQSLTSEFSVKAFFAVQPGRKCLLFIHGYGGSALSTWSHFDRLLISRPEFNAYDLLFYDYDGLYSELVASATLFQNFLRLLFRLPVSKINECISPAPPRASLFGYDEVTIVAHSLGAVIARWALWQATVSEESWVRNTRLVLYAPAHKGANVVKLALEVVPRIPILGLFASFARFKSPLIDQLKEDSRELKALEAETEGAIAKGGNDHLIAKRICIAEWEHVVSNLRFCKDPFAVAISQTSHRTVCKPREDFLYPLNELFKGLQ